MFKMITTVKLNVLLVSNLNVPLLSELDLVGLALIERGAMLLNCLEFQMGATTGFIGLNLKNYMRLVCESNCELFEMNYLEFEGLMNDLGNYS